jgi:allophanate hydrolase subunit 1
MLSLLLGLPLELLAGGMDEKRDFPRRRDPTFQIPVGLLGVDGRHGPPDIFLRTS